MLKKELKDYSLFIFSFNKNTAPRDKIKFMRYFFGYRSSKNSQMYAYSGLLKKLDGVKINNNSFMMPQKNTEVIKAYLESRGVDFIVKE